MGKKNRLYVDVHILQTVPPSCVNRDDTGSPKTAIYGGVVRARVSSQAWKKAIRDMFKSELLASEEIGSRTKRIVAMVTEEMKKFEVCPEEPQKVAHNIFKTAGLAEKSLDCGSAAPLFFISAAQVKALARLAIDDSQADKKMIQTALNSSPSIDVALFGRMVADDSNLNIDACCQVAHSISTHKVNNEYDYFTAIDDYEDEDKTDSGAAMIGTVEFNSSTLYRYATITAHELCNIFAGDIDATANATRKFVDAFVRSMPTGKQNTFANRTLPNAVLVTVRDDQPVNLVGAFEIPVKARDGGFVADSTKAFVEHTKNTYQNWLREPITSFITGDALSALGKPMPFPELLNKLEEEIRGCVL